MISHLVYTLATINGFTGVILGAGLACLGTTIKAEVVAGWHAFCRFAAHHHVKQTTMDTAALAVIDKARPAIDQAFDAARLGLEAERANAAAIEADTTLNPAAGLTPVDAAPLPVVAAVTAVTAVAVSQ